MKFLLIRLSSIGDIVLTTPVIRCLHNTYPAAEIHYLTKKNFSAIVEANPYVSKVHSILRDTREIIEDLRREGFDYILDLHHNLRTLRIKRALKGVASFSFEKLNVEKWVFTNFKINLLPQKHIVDRYMETAASLGVKNDGMGLDYFIPEKDIVRQDDIPFSHLQGYIGIVIGAAHFTKKLSLDKLKELCAKIDHPIILLGGKEDHIKAYHIASIDPIKVYNACGKFTLNESADLVRRSRLLISHDTGLMHIAAAFKKDILSVWGNTVPSFGMFPYKTYYEVFDVKKLWCRPCSKIGYRSCPRGHFKCMNNVSIDSIVSSVNALLKKPRQL